MFKKLLALLLIPSLAFGQAASSVIAEKPIIQGATGVQVVVTGTGEIRLVTSADTTAKGFYLDSSTGNLTSVGSAGIGSATSALGTIFANIVQASTGSNLDLKARNGNVRMFAIGSDSTPVETWRFSSDGTFTQEATNGGDIVISKNGSGLRKSGTGDALFLSGGSSINSSAAGGNLALYGATSGGSQGTAYLYGGNQTTGNVILQNTNASAEIRFLNASSVTNWKMVNDGTFIGAGTGSIGWSVVDGTNNTACTSQCTSPAIFGFELTGDTAFPIVGFVGPAAATADICLCAGAS